MKRILSTIFSSGLCMFAMAIPAKPGFVAYTQPDGSVINVKIVGDEHGHMIYSAEGNLLIESDGRLEYARFDAKGFPTASGIVATKENDSKIASMQIQPKENVDKWASMMTANRDSRLEKLYSKSAIKKASTRAEESENRLVPYNFGRCDVTYPVLGEQKGLVILVSYQDLDFKYGDYDYFNRMLNEEGFSDYGSLGSARDWFVYNSNGQFLPDFDVYGPVVLPNDREYYGGNDAYGNDNRPEEMAIDACRLLDDEIDFTKYDRDGDGVVDNVFIFYAGKGEHDSGIKNTVWPHSWDLSLARPDEEYVFDGVKLDHYACTCEYPSGYKRPDGIGTFVHEFSHVMGLPDLYVTTYTTGFTPGEWSVMDQGPYNNDRLTPPNYSSYEKCALGWLEFKPFEKGRMELTDLSTTNVAYALPTDSENEFYFFENRQQHGNDEFLPGHGMLVWHVDFDEEMWRLNVVNNIATHQYVDLIEADNIKTKTTRNADAFPGPKNVTSFGFETKPQLSSWSKARLSYDLENIAESEDGIISFDALTSGENALVGVEAADDSDNIYYDLSGRRVINPGKGIYIKNGKKVVF
ncbi:MAG: M6 family metalloprotease domain-containing protein [Muribaculaceae bacterium]|nr:M6 family metalloprotease domain-containing protein [Muribaculaceae bacterium]MDE6522912.1 M6 family metalloprotease domain-containing protein [Muribaculaceae bacterium]